MLFDVFADKREKTVIDEDGYRPNVGIIIHNAAGQVLWARRIGQDSWQFPQGGIDRDESPEQALYRELLEEVGLMQADVRLVARTEGWLRYTLPKRYIRSDVDRVCIGQKQKWFLLELVGDDSKVDLQKGSESPEFDRWQWVSYWYPLSQVIEFKREVYQQALTELCPGFIEKLSSSRKAND